MRLSPARLSVIVPTYQGARYLGEALESVVRFGTGDTEVLVVDDGSTDATLAVARSFESRLSLHAVSPARCGNWMAMANRGLAEATGATCCILHQDDRWLPGHRSLPLAAVARSELSMVCSQTAVVDAKDRPLGPWRFPRAVRGCMERAAGAEIARSLYVQNWLAVPSVIFSTEAARACGGLDEQLWYTADWDLWLKLLRCGPALLTGRYGSAFRVHPQSQTVLGSRDVRDFRRQMATVQARHRWALDGQPGAGTLLRAGDLSTSTNVAMAAGLHRRAYGYLAWGRSLVAAGPRGLSSYLDNASLGDRLRPRARLAARGALLRAQASDDGPGPPAGRAGAGGIGGGDGRRARSASPVGSAEDSARNLAPEPEPTRRDGYTRRLVRLQQPPWKRLLDVQAAYRWKVRRLFGTREVLDLGCGIGRNLDHLRPRAVGVDHNPRSVEHCRRRGLTAFTPEGFLSSEYARPARFQGLLAAHLIEHMTRSQATKLLQAYLGYLAPGGRVVLICPQERGFRSDASHVQFTDLDALSEIAGSLGLVDVRRSSFPLPRVAGNLFTYNEFVVAASKP